MNLVRLVHWVARRKEAAVRRYLGTQTFLTLLLAAAAGCGKGEKKTAFPFLEKLHPAPTVQTNLAQLQADDGQWIMPAKNYASTRFSGLNQIHATNIANPRVAWRLSLGSARGEERAALVGGSTMYVVARSPTTLHAADCTP